jgi:hypothetical protein
MLAGLCLGSLCLLRLGLLTLPRSMPACHSTSHRTYTSALAGISCDSTDCRSAKRTPGRTSQTFTAANRWT